MRRQLLEPPLQVRTQQRLGPGLARIHLFDRAQTQPLPMLDDLAVRIGHFQIINEIVSVTEPLFRANDMEARIATPDYDRVNAGRKDAPVGDARLNAVQRRVARAGISQDEGRGQIRSKPVRAGIRFDLRNAFPGC